MRRKNLPRVYFVILHQSKYTKYLGKSMEMLYKMKCSENNLVRDTTDGRWFHLKNSGKVGLNGIRKVGSCHGSLICTYENCPKLTTENVYNKIDFKREGQKQYTCGVCSYYAQRIYQGEHNCHPKPNYQAKQDLMDQQSIPPSSFGSALESKKVWMNYHLQRGDIHMARKIANKISDADIAARIKRLRRNPNHPLSSQDEIEYFQNISNLKKEFSKKYGDTYLIYKMCCEPLQGEPSYIFKTSKTSLQIAAKMAGKLNSKGCETHLKFEPAYFDGMHRRV